MQLKMRTVQLILFLTDIISHSPKLLDTRLELIVVSSIYFVLKLQGDFSQGILEFNDFVKNQLKFEKSLIIQTELLILENVPPNFASFLTFSEYLIENFPKIKLFDDDEWQFILKATEISCGFYLFGGSCFGLLEIIGLSVKHLIDNNDYPEIVKKNCKSITKIINHSIDKNVMDDFQNYIAEENAYVGMIFQTSFKASNK